MFWLWNELFGFPVNSCDYENIECNKSYVPILNWDNDNEFVWSLWDPIDWGVDASNVTFNSKDIQKRPSSIRKVDEALEHLMSKIEQSKSSIQSFTLTLNPDWETMDWSITYIDDAWVPSTVDAHINLKNIVQWRETLTLQNVTVSGVLNAAEAHANEAFINTATIWDETVTTSSISSAQITSETVNRSTIETLTATDESVTNLTATNATVTDALISNWDATFNWTNTFNTDIDANTDVNVAGATNTRNLNVENVTTLNWQLNANGNAAFDKNVSVNWISNLNTLNVAWYSTFADKSTFNEDVTVNDTLVANSNVSFNWHTDVNTFRAKWQATFNDDVDVDHDLNVDWNAVVEGNARIDGTMTVAKNAEFQKNVSVTQNADITWTLDVGWKTTLSSVDVNNIANIDTANVDTATIANLTVTDTLELPDWALDQFQARSEKSQPNGYASLDSTWKVPVEELPDTVVSWTHYKWTWEPTSNYPANPRQWDFYKVTAEGTHAGVHFDVGDVIIYNGSSWDRIPAGDTVQSVNWRTWAVTGLEETSNKVSTLDMVNPSQVEYPSEYAVVTAVNTVNSSISNVAWDLSNLTTVVWTKANANNVYTKLEVDTLLETSVEQSQAFQDLEDQVNLLPTKAYVDWQDNLKANVTDVYDKDTMDQLLADKAHVTHTHTTAEVTWLATQLATYTADIAALDTRVDALESDMADVKDDILDVNNALTHKADIDLNWKISPNALPDNVVTVATVQQVVTDTVTTNLIESRIWVSFRTYTIPMSWTTATYSDSWITARANVLWTWTWELNWHITWTVSDWEITITSTESEAGNFYVTLIQPV